MCALALLSCTSSPQIAEPTFSGVTREDVRELEFLIAHRPDILKPILRVHLIRPDKAELVSGQDTKVGDSFDTFTATKRNGRWRIDSSVVRDTVAVVAP